MERWLEPVVLFGVGAACFMVERATLGRSDVKRREYVVDLKSLGMAVVSSAVVAALVNAVFSPVHSGSLRDGRVVVTVVVFDAVLYGLHRVCHSWWWPIHRRQHAPKHFEASMAFRDSWSHLFVYALLLRATGVAFGLSAAEFAVVSSVFIAAQWWTHLRIPMSLGVLDFVLIGPRHHAIHHHHDQRDWATNLGGLLCVWDQLFGTYAHPFPERLLRKST